MYGRIVVSQPMSNPDAELSIAGLYKKSDNTLVVIVKVTGHEADKEPVCVGRAFIAFWHSVEVTAERFIVNNDKELKEYENTLANATRIYPNQSENKDNKVVFRDVSRLSTLGYNKDEVYPDISMGDLGIFDANKSKDNNLVSNNANTLYGKKFTTPDKVDHGQTRRETVCDYIKTKCSIL